MNLIFLSCLVFWNSIFNDNTDDTIFSYINQVFSLHNNIKNKPQQHFIIIGLTMPGIVYNMSYLFGVGQSGLRIYHVTYVITSCQRLVYMVGLPLQLDY